MKAWKKLNSDVKKLLEKPLMTAVNPIRSLSYFNNFLFFMKNKKKEKSYLETNRVYNSNKEFEIIIGYFCIIK